MEPELKLLLAACALVALVTAVTYVWARFIHVPRPWPPYAKGKGYTDN